MVMFYIDSSETDVCSSIQPIALIVERKARETAQSIDTS